MAGLQQKAKTPLSLRNVITYYKIHLYLELKISSLIFLYLFIFRYNILNLPKVEYHNELHNEGDIQEGDVDGEDKLEQLHHDSHNTVRK